MNHPIQHEIRQNIATRQWIIFAPERGERPSDFLPDDEPQKPDQASVHDDDCPFCDGNEHMLTEIIREHGGTNKHGWQTRVVPNKFPVLETRESTHRYRRGGYLVMPAHGRHEVIIESPIHHQDIPDMTPEEVGVIIETYQQRYVELMREHDSMMCIIFRNHGAGAGTSLSHPHSQLVVTGVVPNYIRRREEEAQRYFDEWGQCVYCDMLALEKEDDTRIILENASFLAFVPFAAEVPFEVWIVPKRHRAVFGNISDAEKHDLQYALHGVLTRLTQKLGDPDYNYIINSGARYRTGEPQLHWYLQVRPRLVTRAGFEIGSGIGVNPSLPEENAKLLKYD